MNPGTMLRAARVHAWRWSAEEMWLLRQGMFMNFAVPEATDVLDLDVAGDRIVVLAGRAARRAVIETTMTAGTFGAPRRVSPQAARVAVTASTTFVASDAEVVALRDPPEIIQPDPLDLAAAPDALAVLGDRGVTLLDADGRGAQVVTIRGSAIARDPVDPGWLVATSDAIVHLHPDGRIVRLADAARGVRRLSRTRAAIYVETERAFLEITAGGVAVELPRERSWDADAGGLYTETGGSFSAYFDGERCACGGRRLRRYASTGHESDGTSFTIFAVSCLACQQITMVNDSY